MFVFIFVKTLQWYKILSDIGPVSSLTSPASCSLHSGHSGSLPVFKHARFTHLWLRDRH